MTKPVPKRLMHLWPGVKISAKAAGGVMAAYYFLATGGAIARNGQVFAIAVIVLVAIPVVGFTFSQVTLTGKGRRVATTIEDVRALKQSDAMAFTQLFAALIRKLSARQVYPDQDLRSRTSISIDRPDGPTIASGTLARRDLSAPGDATADEHSAAGTFWGSLTVAERRALAASARQETFAAGAILWRQHQHADHAVVIRSGQVSVYTENATEKRRVIATRGPGDIVGERAALHAGIRSATVVAVNAVRALVIQTEDFVEFADDHPRVIKVMEDQIYGRLAESQPNQLAVGEAAGLFPAASGSVRSWESWAGQNCSIFLTDITAFSDSSRDDQDRIEIRGKMYRMLAEAFTDCCVPWHECYREDRGDGALIIIPPGTPTYAVVDAVVMPLAAALRLHNHHASDAVRIQLRVAIHVGPVTKDPEGISGHAINEAARFVEAAPLKKRMAECAADLGFVASRFVYDTAISQRSGSISPTAYRKIQFQAKKSRHIAWMYLSGTAENPTHWALRATRSRPDPATDHRNDPKLLARYDADAASGISPTAPTASH
jgi:CRP-like cAMP-binding protein